MQAPLREEIAEFYDSLDPESLEQVIDDLGAEVRAAMALKRFRKQAKERAKARMQLNPVTEFSNILLDLPMGGAQPCLEGARGLK